MRIIKDKETVLAKHIMKEDASSSLNFFSEDQEFIQVGVWNYDKGKELQAHIHNIVERKVTRTCEVIYVIFGSIKASIYSLDAKKVDEFIVSEGETLILLDCGHGYEILEDNTKVLEVKNGPYLGADIDRYRINLT